jgi:hypothetical protein
VVCWGLLIARLAAAASQLYGAVTLGACLVFPPPNLRALALVVRVLVGSLGVLGPLYSIYLPG